MLSAFADRELSGEQMIQVRRHVDTCPDCARELAGIRMVKSVLAESVCAEPPRGLESRLRSAVLESVPRRRERFHAASMIMLSGAAAAALAVALVARTKNPATPVDSPMAVAPASDYVYVSGADPLGNHVPVLPASYPRE